MSNRRAPALRDARRVAGFIALAGVIMAVPVLLMMPEAETRGVLLPIVGVLVVAASSIALLGWRERELPVDEVGLWYIAAVASYAILPLLVYLALGMRFTLINDARLMEIDPAPGEVAFFGWLYVLYLASFAVGYLPIAIGARPVRRTDIESRRSRVGVAAFLWLTSMVFAIGLGMFYDLSAESYTESYKVVQQLPLAVRQIDKVMRGLRFVSALVVIVWMFQDYERRRWLIALTLVTLTALTLLEAGSRTELVLLYAASAILYHRFVGPIRLRFALPAGLFGLIFFLAFGLYRTWRMLEDPGQFEFGVSAGEFESIFANAVDLWARRDAGQLANVPAILLVGDMIGFIPSQALPFQKIDAAGWYLSSFYPEFQEAGGGFAFGVLAQSIVGYGIPELIVRGLLVGVASAALFRWYRSRVQGQLGLVLYIWLTLTAYQSFRMTTFYITSEFVQQLLFSIVVIELGRRFIDEAVDPARARAPHTAPRALAGR